MIILLIISLLLIIFGVMLTLASLIKWGAIFMSIGALITIGVKLADMTEKKNTKRSKNKNMQVGDLVRIKINRTWKEGRIMRIDPANNDWDLLDIRLMDTQMIRGISSEFVEKVSQ